MHTHDPLAMPGFLVRTNVMKLGNGAFPNAIISQFLAVCADCVSLGGLAPS